MKTRVYIIALLSVVTIVVTAQSFSQKPANTEPIQSQQIMSTGAAYNGTVYEPFSNTTPSEQTEVGANYSPAKAPGAGPRKGFDTGGETGQSEEYPIGDALFPLMLMVILFASDIFFRRQKTVKE